MSLDAEAHHRFLSDFFSIATADNAICGQFLKAGDNIPFWRRMLYRSVFSSLESYVSILKQEALLISENSKPCFTEEEVLLLRDVECAVGDDGTPQSRKAKIRFLPNLKFALRSYARSYGRTVILEKDAGWDALTRSVKVRDRITHPKAKADLEITEREIDDLQSAWMWFVRHLGKALDVKQG